MKECAPGEMVHPEKSKAVGDQARSQGVGFPQMPDFDWADLGTGTVRALLQRWRDEKSLEPELVRSLQRDVCSVIQLAKQHGSRIPALELVARATAQALGG